MRRSDKALPNDALVKILQEGEYGVLSTVSADGQPYGVPLNYALQNNNLYFHCALDGHKLDNLLANHRFDGGHADQVPSGGKRIMIPQKQGVIIA